MKLMYVSRGVAPHRDCARTTLLKQRFRTYQNAVIHCRNLIVFVIQGRCSFKCIATRSIIAQSLLKEMQLISTPHPN